MRLFRFIFPFLFVRNWHDGSWELSPVRLTLFAGLATFLLLALLAVYLLQSPVVYTRGASL